MTAHRTLSLLALTGAALAPLPALAQDEGADTPIVVTGQLPSEARVRETVRRVARTVDGQLARFDDKVCPHVNGFDAPYAAMVVERIRRTAARAGVDVAPQGCEPNLFVVVVDDGAGFVRELARRHPEAVEGLSKREFDRLATADDAARSWSATIQANSAGQAAGRPSSSLGSGSVKTGYAGSSVSFGDVNVMRIYEASNINPSIRQVIFSSWVVLETEATFGKSLRQIADYAAMRGLAMVRPAELDGSEDTILHLFEANGEAAPGEASPFDLAYLTSLYRAPSQRWAHSQVRYMADAITDEAVGANP